MNTDAVLLAIAVIGLVTTFGITLYLVGYFRSAPEPTDSNHRPAGAAAANARQLNRGELRALRRRRQGVAAVNERAEQREQDMQAEHAENFEGEEEEDGGGPRVAGTSRKAMQKELKRQERERMRKFEASRREEVKRLREAKEEAHRKRLEAADADEDAREAELEAMRLHQEVKAKADFERWRAFMSVEDTGVDAAMADDESAESERLHAVAEYVQSLKVVVLEEVAAEFGLRTEAVKDHIEKLVASGRLSGILDDRGKFITLSDDEMNAVALHIQRKGRVTLHELGLECNRLIHVD